MSVLPSPGLLPAIKSCAKTRDNKKTQGIPGFFFMNHLRWEMLRYLKSKDPENLNIFRLKMRTISNHRWSTGQS